MNNSHFARNSFTKTWLTASIAAFALLLVVHSASAALLFSWKQTGSDVTATVSGEIDAAWGGSVFNASEKPIATQGGYGSAFTGYGFGPYLQYGDSTGSGYVEYYVDPYFADPSISGIAGFLVVEGGVVQAGSTPYFLLEVNSSSFPYLWLEVLPGTTTINSTVVWSDKLLTDFFTAGVPVRSEIFNSSDQLLMTLEIGEFAPEPIPEPGTWAAAALLVGGAAFMRWRRRQTA
jgi:MYXO-CTERM domain-containing protein